MNSIARAVVFGVSAFAAGGALGVTYHVVRDTRRGMTVKDSLRYRMSVGKANLRSILNTK